MDLYELLEKVEDEKSFLVFAKALLNERLEDIKLEEKNQENPYSPTYYGWENTTLSGFLESAISWADDTDFGKSQNLKNNTWYKFAVFLYCGKIYE